ncbi:MAG: aromatic ring-hydroxylating dioxygenase subunit alpha [Actinomycetota bacterium]
MTAASIPWTDEAAWVGTRKPLAEASSLPAACYTDQDFFDLEQQRVFGTGWVPVAIADQVVKGRLLVRQIGGTSIVLTRNGDGELRGFLNSCRHRGTELAEADCDIRNTIRCPYHRWGYNLDGTLVATPRFAEAGVEDFDPGDYGLHPVRVGRWGVLIFACLDPTTMPLEDWIGDLADRTWSYRLDEWRTVETRDLEIKANWKLISENFQEYYHLAWVHPELAKVSRVEDHYRYQGPGMYCGQTTTPVSGEDRDDWVAMPPAAGLSESDAASGRFIAVFPNVLLSLLPNHVFVMMLHPVAPGLTIETCTFLLPPSTPDVPEDGFGATRSFWFDVNDEDIGIVEAGQRGLERGGFTIGRLSPRFEEPLHRFHNMLADRFVGLDRVPPGDPNDHEPRLGTKANPLPYISG